MARAAAIAVLRPDQVGGVSAGAVLGAGPGGGGPAREAPAGGAGPPTRTNIKKKPQQ